MQNYRKKGLMVNVEVEVAVIETNYNT